MTHKIIKKILFFIVLNLTLFACSPTAENKKTSGQKQESCLECHDGLTGFSNAHNPQAIGCSSCHLGNGKSFEEDIAHKGLVKIPGNLHNATQTCSSAQCHKSEFKRIENSLMTTNSGIVSIDKYVFEETAHTDTFLHIENIRKSAADTHLKNLCYKCHLGYEKKYYGKTTELSRGGGCLACHLNYNGHIPDIRTKIHPSVDLNIGNEKCFGCHSRSSRISTNYEGWYETTLTKNDATDTTKYRILPDGRVFAIAEDDIHHKAGLLCIDCHSSIDVMGDGNLYKHQNEAVKIQCIDCHTNEYNNKVDKHNAGIIAVKDYVLRKYKYPTEQFIATQNGSFPLVNTGFDKQNKPFLIGKIDQRMHKLNSLDRCEKDKIHKNLDCTMCHTSWVTSCIGCHTGYDDRIKIKGKEERGKWYEEIGEFNKSLPVMGVSYINGTKKIIPAIPGMIMTLDKTKFRKEKYGHDSIFMRLFAPISAHTVTDKTRDCKSCHSNPEALGYGKGKLTFIKNGNKSNWKFESLYDEYRQDSLPQDAWIEFLSPIDYNTKYSAHSGFFPLDLNDQKKVLRVGACLECHNYDDIFTNKLTFAGYKELLEQKSDMCTMPF